MFKCSKIALSICLVMVAAPVAAQRGGDDGGELPELGEVCSSDGSSYTLVVEVANDIRTVKSSGCPNYDWTSQTTPGEAKDQYHEKVFPESPVVCTEPTALVGTYTDNTATTLLGTNAVQGPIGVAFNGVPIFGNADGAKEDAYVNEGNTFNQCNGHSGPGGGYHYHAQVPDECLLVPPTAGTHSDLFGIMADGIPIYGPLGDGGVVPTDLDECNGHVDETHPYYHYHVAAEYKYPYTVNCLKGQIDATKWGNTRSTTCTAAATQYDYSFLDTEFVSLNSSAIAPATADDSGASSATASATAVAVVCSAASLLLA